MKWIVAIYNYTIVPVWWLLFGLWRLLYAPFELRWSAARLEFLHDGLVDWMSKEDSRRFRERAISDGVAVTFSTTNTLTARQLVILGNTWYRQ